MGALANPEVGKYLEKYFVSAYQRVGTFVIVQTPTARLTEPVEVVR